MEIIKQIGEACDHHHHEHDQKDSEPPDGITSRIHDGALVCSAGRHITGDLEQVKQVLEKELGWLDAWVEEQGGITGHIKSIISVNGPVYKISATAGEVDTKKLSIKNIHVAIVAIVFQIDQDIMEKRIEELFESLLKEEGDLGLTE